MFEELSDNLESFFDSARYGWSYLNYQSAADLADAVALVLPPRFEYRGFSIADVSSAWYSALDYVLPLFRLLDMVAYARLWVFVLMFLVFLKLFSLSVDVWQVATRASRRHEW